jgi:hypothetical protein
MSLAVPKDAYLGANAGATRANDLLRQANGSGQAHGDRPSPRTNPDDAERLTCIYGSEGWRFESLRARHPYPQVTDLTPHFQTPAALSSGLVFGLAGLLGACRDDGEDWTQEQ